MASYRLIESSNLVQLGLFLAGTVVGSLFIAGYLVEPSIVERWESVVFAITVLPSFLTLLLLVTGLVITLHTRNRLVGLPQDNRTQKMRLYRVGKDVSILMGYPDQVEFAVGIGSATVYTRKTRKSRRIVLGDRFLREANDNEIKGIVGHELVHAHQKSRRRVLGIIGNELLALQIISLVVPLVSIVFGTMYALVKLSTLPVSWRLEYEADRLAGEKLGSEIMLNGLNKLARTSYLGVSMTHPSLSRRLAKIQALNYSTHQ